MDDELLSVELIKVSIIHSFHPHTYSMNIYQRVLQNGKKAVVGSQDGVLSLWTYGDWGDYTDRYLGHPSSIDTICKLDEDTICTGSSDGIIR